MAKKKTETERPDVPVVIEEKGGLPSEMTMDAGTEIMKSEGQGEIQAAVVLAKRFPRDEERAKASLLAACDLEEFAGGGDAKKPGAYYSFPRGRTQDDTGEWKPNIVSGASVRMAREAARLWGNLRYGFFITHDDDDARGIVAWAWDLEKNLRISGSDFFRKVIQRKEKGGGTIWITADERELRELTFRKAAILIRNSILQLMPGYFIDQAVAVCKTTAAGGAKTDLKDRIIMMQRAFTDIGVSGAALEKYLGKPVAKSTREDLADLRGIYESLRDGMISKEEREEMFGPATQSSKQKPEAVIGERHEGGLSMDKIRSAENQIAPHEEKPAPKKEEKKAVKVTAIVKPTNGKNAEPEKFDPRETALTLIRNATKENWAAVKETVLGMVKEIKGSQNLLDVTSAINNRQREMSKKEGEKDED